MENKKNESDTIKTSIISKIFSQTKRAWVSFVLTSGILFGLLPVFVPQALAISATNVQPANLVQSNRVVNTITFTSAVTIPANGKIKIIYPAGFDVSGATGGTCTTTMNGGFTTSVSGQTVTISRDNTGLGETAAIETCTVNNINNPSATGSTGTYTIGLYTSADVLLEQDAAVTADTIIAPGTLGATSNVAENTVEFIRSRRTITFTTINGVTPDGKIEVIFPAGVNPVSANSGTCSTMDGTFSTSVSGQTVTITRGGTGIFQAAAVETCTIDGIIGHAVGVGGTFTFTTRDGQGTTTDLNAAVTGITLVSAGTVTATNVQPTSLVAGASTTQTITFTTPAGISIPMTGKIRVTFPTGYSLATAGVAACSVGYAGTVAFSVSGQVLTLSRTGATTTTAGSTAVSCTLTTVRNPQVSGTTGTYSIEVIDDQSTPVLISSDMAIPGDAITAGVLVGTPNVQPENLVAGIKSISTVTFITANPLPANGHIDITYPVTAAPGYDVSGASGATCIGTDMDGTFATVVDGQKVKIQRTGTTAIAGGVAITCTINNIIAPGVGASGTYLIETETNADVVIDQATPAADTFVVAPALTLTTVVPNSPVVDVRSDNTLAFTIAQNIPAKGKIKIIFPVAYDVSGVTNATCTGFDGTLTTTNDGVSTITMTRNGGSTTVIAGAKTCTIYNIKNPNTAGAGGTKTVTITDQADVTIATLATVASTTILASPGPALTLTNIEPASLTAGATGTALVIFTTAATSGLPTNGKIVTTFPAGYDVSGATTGGTCIGITGTVTLGVVGQVVTLSRDTTSVGVPISTAVTCSINNIKNPVTTGATGAYTLALADSAGTAVSANAAPTSDTITTGLLSSTNVEPDTLVTSANTTQTATFTATNAVPSDGKIVVGFPAGFNLSGVVAGSMVCSGLSGSLSSSFSGTTITAVRSGGSATTAGAAFTCTMTGITNPASAGTGGTYLIRTTTSADVAIDEATAVTSDTFANTTALTSTNVEPAVLTIPQTGNVTITFTSVFALSRSGKVNVTFPAGFNVASASGGTCAGMDGTFATSVVGQVVTITRNGTTPSAAGAKSCTLSNITSPMTIGAAGTYTISMTTNAGSLIQQDTAVTSDTFTAPSLTSTNVEPASLIALSTNVVTVSFTSILDLPANGKVRVTFGAGYNVAGATGGTCTGMDGTFATGVAGQVVTITRTGITPKTAGAMTCTINNIVNSGTVGLTGVYGIEMLTSANLTIQQNLSVTEDSITGPALTGTDVQPASLTQSTYNNVVITFTTTLAIPNDGKIRVTFPAAFGVLDAAGGTCSSMDGSFITSKSGQVVTITRSGGTSALAGAHNCLLTTILNPQTLAATGPYGIATLNGSDITIQNDLAVPQDTFVAAPVVITTPVGGGGGGSGGGGGDSGSVTTTTVTPPVHSTTTTSGTPTISSIISSPMVSNTNVVISDALITTDSAGIQTAVITSDAGSLLMKASDQSLATFQIPMSTTLTADKTWDRIILAPTMQNIATIINAAGEPITGSTSLLKPTNILAIVEIGTSSGSTLSFSKNVTVTIPVTAPDNTVVNIYTSKDGKIWTIAGLGIVKGGTVIVITKHMSYYAVEKSSTALVKPVIATPTTSTVGQIVDNILTNPGHPFVDTKGHWAEAYIDKMFAAGVVSGRSPGIFSPNMAITRAELTTMAVRAFGIPITTTVIAEPFTDVKKDVWYAPYVFAAKKAGIVQGYGTKFLPEQSINRAEALKIFLEAAKFTIPKVTKSVYKDVSIYAWYAKYVMFATTNKIVSGYPDGTFRAKNFITRAEVAKIVSLVLDLKK